MAEGAAVSAKTQSERPSTREDDGALSGVGLIAMTIAGLGFVALVSIVGSRAIGADEGETVQGTPSIFCPLHGSTFDWSPALATTEGPDADQD